MPPEGLGVRLAAAGSVALLAGCAARGAGAKPPDSQPHAAAARADKSPRRGLGIAVDPELELPPPTTAGSAEKGIMVLAAPVDTRPALRVVSDFFEAASAESIEMMERLLERAAHTRGSPKARPEAALPSWRRRFDRLDYTPLATELVYRAADVKVHTAADAAADGAARLLPVVPKGDEILVQVFPVGQTASKLFGGEVDFVLRPAASTANGYKIAELVEDFRLP